MMHYLLDELSLIALSRDGEAGMLDALVKSAECKDLRKKRARKKVRKYGTPSNLPEKDKTPEESGQGIDTDPGDPGEDSMANRSSHADSFDGSSKTAARLGNPIYNIRRRFKGKPSKFVEEILKTKTRKLRTSYVRLARR